MLASSYVRTVALASMFAALSVVLTACSDGVAQPAPGTQPPPPEVTVVRVQPEKVTVYEEYVGQTDAVDTVEIRSRITGLLERQVAPDGAFVRKGQPLFVLDKEPFVAVLQQVRAQLAQAEANAQNSKQVLERLRLLVKEQAATQQDLEAAIAKERVDSAAIEVARAVVRTNELNLSYTEIVAPRDGVLSRALVRPGGVVAQAATLLATLYAVDPMYVNFTVPEGRVFTFQKRLAQQTGRGGVVPYEIRLPDGSVLKQPSRLSYVDPGIDPKNGTLLVRLALANGDRSLRPGFLVTVRVPAYENAAAVRIPGRAVTEILGRRSVYVVKDDGSFETRDLVAAQRAGQDWLVEKGFEPGEQVIVEGTARVRPGMTKVKPMPPRPSGGAPGKGPEAKGNAVGESGAKAASK
jgi:membrane fusion protein (multidrug efflux system)